MQSEVPTLPKEVDKACHARAQELLSLLPPNYCRPLINEPPRPKRDYNRDLSIYLGLKRRGLLTVTQLLKRRGIINHYTASLEIMRVTQHV